MREALRQRAAYLTEMRQRLAHELAVRNGFYGGKYLGVDVLSEEHGPRRVEKLKKAHEDSSNSRCCQAQNHGEERFCSCSQNKQFQGFANLTS